LKPLVGTFLTTPTLILTTGDKDKAATSSPQPVLLKPSLKSGALVLLDPVLTLVWVVVAALLMKDLTAVIGFTPMLIGAVTILLLNLMLDFPVFKPTEEVPVPSVSKVPSTLRLLDLKALSASSSLAVARELPRFLLLMLAASQLNVLRKDPSLYLVMLVLLTALIQLLTALLPDPESAPEDVWVEVAVWMVFANAILATVVKTVL